MATPRKREPRRDKLKTMRKFVKAIGSLLTRLGFSGLKPERIAREAGHDSSLITRYFGDLAGLQRAYIMEIDYWVPFFERFTLSTTPELEEVRSMFSALMKENFRTFFDNVEFQNVILWQISENNALMREISDDRERRGEILFRASDPAFAGSSVNFRAVTGLLLGGIYYMVLQARSIKGAVCGIDLNLEQHRLEVMKTIEQLINAACDLALKDQNEIQKSLDMNNYDFELLESVAAQLAMRSDDQSGATADIVVKNETRKLTRLIPQHLLSLSSDTQVSSFLKLTLNRLTEIADLLYQPGRTENVNAKMVIDLMDSVFRHFPDVIPGAIVLPKLYGFQRSAGINDAWQEVKLKLEGIQTDPFLLDIIYKPLKRFIHAGIPVHWSEYTYLQGYLKTLQNEVTELKDQQDLLDLLIGLGHNHARFSAYYTDLLRQSVEGKPEQARVAQLSQAKTRIGQVISWTNLSFEPGKVRIVDELTKWIDLEIARSVELGKLEANVGSLITPLNATQLAVLGKLMYDAGIFIEPNLNSLSRKIALNFMTKGEVLLSEHSIKSKLFNKEPATFKHLEPFVLKILEEIRRFL